MHKVDERCWASFISWNTNLNNFTLWSREKELNKKSAHTLSHTHTQTNLSSFKLKFKKQNNKSHKLLAQHQGTAAVLRTGDE